MAKRNDRGNIDNSWMGGTFVFVIVISILIAAGMSMVTSCSPRVVEKYITQIKYRDRIVHDTATVEIPKEVEKIVTLDTISKLENKYARSEAVVSKGFLSHSLESIPQVIKGPVTVEVRDTVWKEQEIKEVEKLVEKELSWWQKFRLDAFWWLVLGAFILLFIVFRKPIGTLLKL